MGYKFLDKYSILHFVSGFIAYFFGINWIMWLIIHIMFEYGENTPEGMELINTIPIWPGGKENPDALVNSIGDTLSALLGWLTARYIFMS